MERDGLFRVGPIQNEINPFHTIICCFYKIQFILQAYFNLSPDLPNGLFPSDFPTEHINYKILSIE
jgi:hypothetical protein